MISIEDCEGRPKDTDLAAKNILHRVSVKSILVGGLVDIGLSLGLGIPLALYELSKVGTTGVYTSTLWVRVVALRIMFWHSDCGN